MRGLQASYNPLGIQLVSQLYYRLRLVKSEGILWDSSKIDIGIKNNISPGFDLLGLMINYQPIAFFNITFLAQAAGYFNWLGYGIRNLQNYDSAFNDDAFEAGTRNGFGYLVSVAPTFQFAYDRFYLFNTLYLTQYFLENGKGYVYERIGGVALKKNDIELANSAYFAAEVWGGIKAGINDYLVYVPNSGYVSHRLSGLIAYTNDFTPDLSLYATLLLGTFLADKYQQYTFFIGGQCGITLHF